YVIQAAMPTGINALVVAHAYGLELRTLAAAIAWGTAIVIVAALVASAVTGHSQARARAGAAGEPGGGDRGRRGGGPDRGRGGGAPGGDARGRRGDGRPPG